MRRSSICTKCVAVLFIGAYSAQAATLYATVSGAGDCLAWGSACTLANAIAAAQDQDSIWVKAGTYPPIVLPAPVNGIDVNIKIIGGFAGTETLASQSKPAINVTTIDGGGVARCVSSTGHDSTTVLRGLRFINGYDADDFGGGAIILWESSPTIVDCIFESNTAKYVGGAVTAQGSCSPSRLLRNSSIALDV